VVHLPAVVQAVLLLLSSTVAVLLLNNTVAALLEEALLPPLLAMSARTSNFCRQQFKRRGSKISILREVPSSIRSPTELPNKWHNSHSNGVSIPR
jgi:hypothetical protein